MCEAAISNSVYDFDKYDFFATYAFPHTSASSLHTWYRHRWPKISAADIRCGAVKHHRYRNLNVTDSGISAGVKLYAMILRRESTISLPNRLHKSIPTVFLRRDCTPSPPAYILTPIQVRISSRCVPPGKARSSERRPARGPCSP